MRDDSITRQVFEARITKRRTKSRPRKMARRNKEKKFNKPYRTVRNGGGFRVDKRVIDKTLSRKNKAKIDTVLEVKFSYTLYHPDTSP
ncbi:hypothetical protein ILUMI_09702 [Ignelater luminosus]|uniref:Uncharacterized protein n=1 Tax=Ignelater luminosus TaxID=2038154 RepID=A0A8K0GFQ3_IGNLU|nr:hypothetical protein ILUMI_09702 [Ignelater luminosus]